MTTTKVRCPKCGYKTNLTKLQVVKGLACRGECFGKTQMEIVPPITKETPLKAQVQAAVEQLNSILSINLAVESQGYVIVPPLDFIKISEFWIP